MMKRCSANSVVLTALLLLCGCHLNVKIAKEDENLITENIAVEFVNAYNKHESDKMLSLAHENIKYMYVDGATIFTETNNKSELADFLRIFFKQRPNAHSEIVSSYKNNRYIHQIEKAIWKDQAGKQKAQCSLSVYELEDELIINVWYHQTYQCAVSGS